MRCAWDKLLAVLPPHMRPSVDKLGKEGMQELRIRVGRPTELVRKEGGVWLPDRGKEEDLNFIINTGSKYSPWAAETISSGYITAPGGHRIGICGDAIVHNGKITGIRRPTSICLRVARDFPGIAGRGKHISGNVLIIGPPGSGKTTLLRDWVRQISGTVANGIAVVDERGELFPDSTQFDPGPRTDVLFGCDKPTGIEMVLKTMGPGCIAVDEVTSERDCVALMQAGWCGVRLLATAHAASVADLKGKQIYRELIKTGLFEFVFVMQKDKSWNMERL